MMADLLGPKAQIRNRLNFSYLTLSCRGGCDTRYGELKRCVEFVEAPQAEDERVESHCREAVRAEASKRSLWDIPFVSVYGTS